ncbi:MAG: phosphomannomutase/phosphoglucomutase [Legionellaceae bacterium]|nr:phosphomannomutase/phosphoglucomutase [Legionellaceae bacterium]
MTYQQRPVDASVFRAYDIRGIIGQELDADAYYSIGLAFACRMKMMARDTVFLARDGRLTSTQLADALAQGLIDSGMQVFDLGEVATPVLYYATATQSADCGMMVTGSHNPAEYNGIKMVLAGKTMVAEDIQELFELVCNATRLHGQGVRRSMPLLEQYCQRIVQDINLQRPLKVVVDGGNGVAGPTLPAVLSRLGCEVIPLYCEVDGRFPNHHPDPTIPENLVDLAEAVLAHQADIGLAFDGDADRLGVLTERAQIIWPDRLMMFYARDLLAQHADAKIVFDVKCSNFLRQTIEQCGGQAIMCPTGHSIVKGVMRAENAVLAGEMSGHIFFNDRWYGFDDALYSACRLLEILSRSEQSVSQQFASIPEGINTPEIKLPIAEAEKFVFMERFAREAVFPESNSIKIDGLRVEFAKGWGLLRASNTTPCLVMRFEAEDEAELRRIQSLFRQELQRMHPVLARALNEVI